MLIMVSQDLFCEKIIGSVVQEILPNQINWALNAFSTFNDLKIKSYINIKRNSYLAQMSI